MNRLLRLSSPQENAYSHGLLSEQQYQNFWLSVSSNDEACGDFIEFVIKKIIAFNKKEQLKEQKRGKMLSRSKNIDVQFSKESMVSTLYFVALFLRVGSVESKVVSAISKLEKFGQESNDPDMTEVAYMLGQRISQTRTRHHSAPAGLMESPHMQQLSRKLINNFIDTVTSHPVTEYSPRLRPGTCLLWPYLRYSLSMGRYADVLVKSLHGVLKLGSTMLSDTRFALTLHLLRSMIFSLPSLTTRPALDGLLQALLPFVVWPEPYSSMVRRLISLIKQEQRMPGHALRQLLASSLLRPNQGPILLSPHHVLHCPTVTPSHPFAQHEPNTTISAIQLKLAIITDFILSHMTLDPGHNYAQVPEDELLSCFDEYNRLAHEVLNPSLPIEEAHRLRMRGARSLNERLRVAAPPIQTTVPFGQSSSQGSVILAESEFGRASIDQLTLPTPEAVPMLPRTSAFPSRLVALTCPTGMHTSGTYNPIRPQATIQLRLIIEAAQAASQSGLRVCIYGNDQVVNGVISAYAGLLVNQPGLFNNLKVVFLVVPCPKPSTCSLATFIASRDPVYRHSIFGPFHDPASVLPVCDQPAAATSHTASTANLILGSRSGSSVNTISAIQTAVPSPQLVFNQEMSFFIWTSQHIHRVHMFQVECFSDTVASTEPIIFPFLHTIEIGSKVEAMVTGKGGFPLTVVMSIHSINPQGHIATSPTESSFCLTDILLSNVPTDRTPTANPCFPGLDLIGTLPDKKLLKKASTSHTGMRVAQDGPVRFHINKVDIRTTTACPPFHITVDSTAYGPFHRIRVSVLKTADGMLTIPFVSHLPVSI